MVDAVLMEFDGVLADTRAARRAALLDTLEEDGITISESEYRDRCAAMPVRGAVRAAYSTRHVSIDDTAIELAAVRAETRFSQAVQSGLSLTTGARAFIELAQAQTRLGIVSRATRADIEATLSLAQLEHAFEFVIADDDAFAPKPSSASYQGAVDRLRRRRAVNAHNVIALEDGATGIHAAKSAGLRCAVVGAIPVHIAVDADGMIPSLIGQTVASLDLVTLGARAAER
jgi:beta-phosphoglucomutase-like phosphatase (HAD superfamily)